MPLDPTKGLCPLPSNLANEWIAKALPLLGVQGAKPPDGSRAKPWPCFLRPRHRADSETALYSLTMNLMLFPAPQHKADEVPSDAELARFIPGNAIAAGRAYAQAGRVLRMSVSDDGNRIEAETQGSRRTPYAETIVLRRDPQGHLRIIGLCSCAVHTNCKHVAAVLIVARGRHKLAPAPAGQVSAISPRPAPGPAGSPQPQARPAPVPPREEPLPYPLANWLVEL